MIFIAVSQDKGHVALSLRQNSWFAIAQVYKQLYVLQLQDKTSKQIINLQTNGTTRLLHTFRRVKKDLSHPEVLNFTKLTLYMYCT